MKLQFKGRTVMEICGDDTAKSIALNLLYGVKYLLMDFRRPSLWLAFNTTSKGN